MTEREEPKGDAEVIETPAPPPIHVPDEEDDEDLDDVEECEDDEDDE